MARLRFGHQRPLNRRCPDEKYQYVNNNRLTEYPGTPAWTPADTRDLLVTGVQAGVDTCDLVVAGVRISISPKYLYLYLELSGSTHGKGTPAFFGNFLSRLYENQRNWTKRGVSVPGAPSSCLRSATDQKRRADTTNSYLWTTRNNSCCKPKPYFSRLDFLMHSLIPGKKIKNLQFPEYYNCTLMLQIF